MVQNYIIFLKDSVNKTWRALGLQNNCTLSIRKATLTEYPKSNECCSLSKRK